MSELIMMRIVLFPPHSGIKPEMGITPEDSPELDTGGERRLILPTGL